jgi:hypothetical protein
VLEVHRTHRAKILNHSQVEKSLDRHGWSASKLWNVANYHSRQVWEKTGEIPDHGDLKDKLKAHNKYKRLHSQSSSFETAKPSRDANELRSLSTARSGGTR